MPEIPAIDGFTDSSDARVVLYQSGRQVHAPAGEIGLVKRPASSSDNAVARWDGTTGKLLQNSSATVDDSGNLAAGAGTFAGRLDLSGVSAGQIRFPAAQNASADTNTLDDYEEGTTTPAPTAGSGAFTTASATVTYTKIGNRVCWAGVITITNAGTAAGKILLPLPFTSGENAGFGGFENATGFAIGGRIPVSATAEILKYDGTTIIASGRVIYVSGNYRV
jgi:hypothetical protein